MRRRRWRTIHVEEDFVGIAPPPVLPWFVRTNKRVIDVFAPVIGGVVIRRTVAAANVATGHAKAEMDPLAARAQTVLAAFT
jgi:hypothetical protein